MGAQGSLFEATDAATPLVVSYGAGVDSTAMLIEMHRRGIRPDLILFADTGSEKAATYVYLALFGRWLVEQGLPAITVVRNRRPVSGDASLGKALQRCGVLPALAYGQHQCSLVWKIDPQDRFLRKHYGWNRAAGAWATARTVVKAIGYDDGPRDRCRAGKAHGKASPGCVNTYPLIEWGIDRAACEAIILAAGLPVPVKSACYFCPAMQQAEIDDLARHEPSLLASALEIEARAQARGLTSIAGLGRRWSWADYVRSSAPADVQRIAGPMLAALSVASTDWTFPAPRAALSPARARAPF